MCMLNNIEIVNRTSKGLMRSNMSFGGNAALFLENVRHIHLFVPRGAKPTLSHHVLIEALSFHS